MIRLLVDSASDYTQEEIRNKNLYFVPLQIQIEGKNYLDGVDIDNRGFGTYAYASSDDLSITLQMDVNETNNQKG